MAETETKGTGISPLAWVGIILFILVIVVAIILGLYIKMKTVGTGMDIAGKAILQPGAQNENWEEALAGTTIGLASISQV